MVRRSPLIYAVYVFLGFWFLKGTVLLGQEPKEIGFLEEAFNSKISKAEYFRNHRQEHEAIKIYYEMLNDPALKKDFADKEYIVHERLAYTLKSLSIVDEAIKQGRLAIKTSMGSEELKRRNKIPPFAFLGAVYSTEGQFDSALVYFKMAIPAAQQIHNTRLVSGALNNVGICFERMELYDSALTYYDHALDLYHDSLNDIDLLFSIQDNRATAFLQIHNYDEALAICEDILRRLEYSEMPEWRNLDRYLQTELLRAKILNESQRYAEAKPILLKLDGALEEFNGGRSEEFTRSLMDSWKDYYYGTGKMAQAFIWAERVRVWDETIASMKEQKLNDARKTLAEFEHNRILKEQQIAAQLKDEQLALSRERSQKKNLLIVLLVVLGCSGGIIGYLFYRRREQFQRKQAELVAVQNQLLESKLREEELEKQYAIDQLRFKQRDLSDMAMSIGRQRKWARKLVEINKSLKTLTVEEIVVNIKQLIEEMESELVLDEKQNLLQEKVEEVGNEFVQQIKDNYPGLSSTELELCTLIRLRLSNKEIARIRNISSESARKARFRLKKKLGLSPEDDLEEILSNL
ncbi:tetratricopeptide repeat protein [bacterium SCSIO 12741]|nr:tetratricopeptide repeat protein [bacterium SCSIO 12741]